jgi:hypothetical protein
VYHYLLQTNELLSVTEETLFVPVKRENQLTRTADVPYRMPPPGRLVLGFFEAEHPPASRSPAIEL